MTVQRTAYNILTEINRGGAYANLALKQKTAKLKPTDAAKVTALVYMTVEHLNYAGYLLKSFVKCRLHGSIKLILSMGITELLFTGKPAYAVCDEYVKLTRDIGKGKLTGFVNGVLRNIDRQRDSLPKLPDDFTERCNIVYGVPLFMVREYLNEYGKEFTENMLASRFHHLTVRICNKAKIAQVLKEFDEKGIKYREGKLAKNTLTLENASGITENHLFRNGSITVQSESAVLVCRACAVKENMKVLDACAAPGGKTAYISALMNGTGRLFAWDIHPHRIELIKNTLARLNVRNVECEARNAAEYTDRYAESMDVVLVDAPCSGFGGGSKHDVYLNRTEDDILKLAHLQQNLLDCCSRYVKPGGALVYSTCTVSKRENEENTRQFLKEHEDFEPESLAFCFPKEYAERVSGGMIQLFPHIDGTDGFFIARMRRKL